MTSVNISLPSRQTHQELQLSAHEMLLLPDVLSTFDLPISEDQMCLTAACKGLWSPHTDNHPLRVYSEGFPLG